MGSRLWVVTPVYRDVPSFLTLRERLLGVLADQPYETWFVVADDTGGLDPQVEELEALPDVLVVDEPFNLGHQRALVFALRKLLPYVADDDIVLTLDADGEDQPEDVPRLFAELELQATDRARPAPAAAGVVRVPLLLPRLQAALPRC